MRAPGVVAIVVAGCAGSIGLDPGLEDLAVSAVAPATIVPGTRLIVSGGSFVDEAWGAATLHLQGMAGGRAVDAAWPARFVDFGTLEVAIDGAKLGEIVGGASDAQFAGTATVEVVSTIDRTAYRSAPREVALAFRSRLTPMVTRVATGVVFVNDDLAIEGDGFLLGGDEGATVARLAGCIAAEGGEGCEPVPAVEVAITAASRTRASFAFRPEVAGIGPGSFVGTLTVVDRPATGEAVSARPIEVAYEVVAPEVFAVDPPAASLGQFVFVHGGGFVGGEPGALTEIELSGTLRRTGGAAVSVQMTWIPEFVGGRLVRYVLNPDDALGHALDLRSETGELSGTVTPVVSYRGARVRGRSRPVSFAIAPIKQVVYLDFAPSYTEGLRDFGLRAVDGRVRERIVAVCREAYRGVNIEFRTAPPTDFAWFETVELVGVDPNDQGLFGYDNSPGKDTGNLRLYDRLGGVNAQIQEDGYPGFGGVFVRSLMGFSQHPGSLARSVDGADPMFDQVFDPFRPDRGGEPIRAADLAGAVPALV
ncbi:MAG TPA: hypothetical protein VFD36_10490, partial [Kofleriaceae bacterium]|nr:hypothetical protein [Kofleriaceae bacterium]